MKGRVSRLCLYASIALGIAIPASFFAVVFVTPWVGFGYGVLGINTAGWPVHWLDAKQYPDPMLERLAMCVGYHWPWIEWTPTSTGHFRLMVPVLYLWLALIATTWFTRPRQQPGFCACGYNLTGNTSGRCPECGASVLARVAHES